MADTIDTMRSPALPLLLAALFAAGAGCADMQVGIGPSRVGLGVGDPTRTTDIVHEPCAVESGTSHDADGNGKADTVHVLANGQEICRGVDLDGDGKHDVFVYFDPNGGVRREERSSRRNGRFDTVTTWKGGVSQRAHDSDGDGKADRWEEHEKGRPVRTFIDVNRDGKVDQVWSWMDHKPGCASIATDSDHDGKFDREHETCHGAPAASSSK